MSDSFVIDPSILIQGYVKEPDTDNVLALLDGLTKPDAPILYTPEFCIVECTNILWRHVRFHEMPIDTALKAVKDIGDLPLTIHLAAAHLSEALTIGITHELAIYDSLYIALAKALDVPLITADIKQERAATAAGVKIKPVADFRSESG